MSQLRHKSADTFAQVFMSKCVQRNVQCPVVHAKRGSVCMRDIACVRYVVWNEGMR